jgi:hypothetical protein
MPAMNDRQGPSADIWAVVRAALAAGSLDLTAAIISTYLSFKLGPVFLLQFIASGAFGRAAFKGGLATAAWGFGLQYVIALFWAGMFWLALPRIAALRRHPVSAGLGYGLLVWLGMNLVVIPLCRAPKVIPNLGQTILGILYVVCFVGLPISLLLNRHFRARRPVAGGQP